MRVRSKGYYARSCEEYFNVFLFFPFSIYIPVHIYKRK